jgi:hypothetical protein
LAGWFTRFAWWEQFVFLTHLDLMLLMAGFAGAGVSARMCVGSPAVVILLRLAELGRHLAPFPVEPGKPTWGFAGPSGGRGAE